MTASTDHPKAPTREQFCDLLRRLRGNYPIAEIAREMDVTRQTILELEQGWRINRSAGGSRWMISNPTLARLEKLGDIYDVDFEITAIDRATGMPVTGIAPKLRNDPRNAD